MELLNGVLLMPFGPGKSLFHMGKQVITSAKSIAGAQAPIAKHFFRRHNIEPARYGSALNVNNP